MKRKRETNPVLKCHVVHFQWYNLLTKPKFVSILLLIFIKLMYNCIVGCRLILIVTAQSSLVIYLKYANDSEGAKCVGKREAVDKYTFCIALLYYFTWADCSGEVIKLLMLRKKIYIQI